MLQQTPDVVRLEIDDDWWLWHPSLRHRTTYKSFEHRSKAGAYRGSYFLEDPMDLKGYDEDKAFPSLKPGIESFGPPSPTRKQRGWYQIVVRPQRSCSLLHAAVQSASGMGERRLATGSDLPGELVSAIVEELKGPSAAHCALVCRSWAATIQAKMFNTVAIGDSHRAAAFLSFLRAPHSNVRDARIEHIRLQQSLQSPPFVHTLMTMIPMLSCHHEPDDVALQLVGPMRNASMTMRSIHCQLPRQPPRCASFGIRNLRLKDVHFKRWDHLIDVICGLPSLETLRGNSLTWPAFTRTSSAMASPALRRWHAVQDRKSTRLNSSHSGESRMPSSA